MNIDAKILNRNPANQAQDLIKVSSAMFKLASYQKYKDSLIYVNQKCNSPHKHIEEKKPHHLLIKSRKGHQKNPIYLHDKSHAESNNTSDISTST